MAAAAPAASWLAAKGFQTFSFHDGLVQYVVGHRHFRALCNPCLTEVPPPHTQHDRAPELIKCAECFCAFRKNKLCRLPCAIFSPQALPANPPAHIASTSYFFSIDTELVSSNLERDDFIAYTSLCVACFTLPVARSSSPTVSIERVLLSPRCNPPPQVYWIVRVATEKQTSRVKTS